MYMIESNWIVIFFPPIIFKIKTTALGNKERPREL